MILRSCLIWRHVNATSMVGLVVSALDSQSWGPRFKSRPGQKFGSRFLLYLRPYPTQLWLQAVSGKRRWWGRELATCPHMPRPRKWSRWHFISYGCPRASWRDYSSSILLLLIIITEILTESTSSSSEVTKRFNHESQPTLMNFTCFIPSYTDICTDIGWNHKIDNRNKIFHYLLFVNSTSLFAEIWKSDVIQYNTKYTCTIYVLRLDLLRCIWHHKKIMWKW